MNRKVLNYKDIEEAQNLIREGKNKGIFSDNLRDIELGNGIKGTLIIVNEKSGHPFHNSTLRFQFFSPEPEPVENWKPFTLADRRVFMGHVVEYRQQNVSVIFMVAKATDTGVEIDGFFHTYEQFLIIYQFSDNKKPCGMLVNE